MKICIGIISYFPDNDKTRRERSKKLQNLINTCTDLFNVPILIIAQNWIGNEVALNKLCTVKNFDYPLGIVGARKELRKEFLNSEYDYLIMLDDDCEIYGSKESAKLYINQILNNPGKCGLFNATLLKLFAISKELFSEVDFGEGSVENGDFFEDILFVDTLQKKYPNKIFTFRKNGLYERSNNFNDPLSTWYHGQFIKREIGDRTREIISKI